MAMKRVSVPIATSISEPGRIGNVLSMVKVLAKSPMMRVSIVCMKMIYERSFLFPKTRLGLNVFLKPWFAMTVGVIVAI